MALTLFVVPALYVKLARNTRSPKYLSRMIDGLRVGGQQRPADAVE